MLNRKIVLGLLLLGAIGLVATVPSAADGPELGKELTAMGAIQAGNGSGSKAGTIPPWTGGYNTIPAGWKPGDHYVDPFASDKPLYKIDGENYQKYSKFLSAGQVAMFERYPDSWYMNVYPSRRSACYPEDIYKAALENAETASLTADGNGVKDCRRTSPFPMPKSGLEVLWNHMLRYRGEVMARTIGQVAPTPDGSFVMVRIEEQVMWRYNREGMSSANSDNILAKFYQGVISPPRLAGTKLHVHESLDQAQEPRKAWVYSAGLRRVRRAPQVAFDNPGTASDGQRTNDQFDMFNGSPERYDWKLIGRQEMIVPYNCYKSHNAEVDPDQMIRAGHLNPDLLRYEHHRVWKVEATVKSGTSHLYAKRVMHFDEDSWQPLVVDQYDNSGKIWRVSEAYPIVYYDIPILYDSLLAHYDLQNGRYLAIGFNAPGQVERFDVTLRDKDFSPAALSRRGRR
ncbi:MAG: DUF1329 domain-containing protein [Planctomycetes bacterium]|jgi:hypothetical protein|nr:DUF1329 domain-containing protein [Planctomycetota bacterium]MBT6453421.1 DUF1329 domain-containing protein [Planctomycetota bacterium]MBT6783527.1 DUF1329 domain-containing protein [Planctomycetota bacterium]MBT6967299.1 DUF1329 domain-containing protein [Planctomycetota bacterium]MBT7104498.1 DUF1329 domain-containing protein [Planctomycetota bacterium]